MAFSVLGDDQDLFPAEISPPDKELYTVVFACVYAYVFACTSGCACECLCAKPASAAAACVPWIRLIKQMLRAKAHRQGLVR